MSTRCVSYRADVQVLQRYKPMYKAIFDDFLLPEGYAGHDHAWREIDAGLCLCRICGAEHVCFRGQCPLVETDASEQVCTISGCVVQTSELRAEREVMERTSLPTKRSSRPGGGTRRNRRRHNAARFSRMQLQADTPAVFTRGNGNVDIHDFVETVVREILDSQKTRQCEAQEMARDHSRRMSALGRLIRENMAAEPLGSDLDTMSPINLVTLEAQLTWHCRKCRPQRHRSPELIERVIRVCVDNICVLLTNHGWQRVARQLQHATRGREFVCSMLYLMRAGMTFENRCLLQKLDILHELLPLQVFLPYVFDIRAKSITEGENIIKLDMRRMPM